MEISMEVVVIPADGNAADTEKAVFTAEDLSEVFTDEPGENAEIEKLMVALLNEIWKEVKAETGSISKEEFLCAFHDTVMGACPHALAAVWEDIQRQFGQAGTINTLEIAERLYRHITMVF